MRPPPCVIKSFNLSRCFVTGVSEENVICAIGVERRVQINKVHGFTSNVTPHHFKVVAEVKPVVSHAREPNRAEPGLGRGAPAGAFAKSPSIQGGSGGPCRSLPPSRPARGHWLEKFSAPLAAQRLRARIRHGSSAPAWCIAQ